MKFLESLKSGFVATVEGAKRFGAAVVNGGKRVVAAVAAVAVAGNVAMAQTAPDATTLVTSATSAANSVMGLCLTVGGFFLVYKIIKWVRK